MLARSRTPFALLLSVVAIQAGVLLASSTPGDPAGSSSSSGEGAAPAVASSYVFTDLGVLNGGTTSDALAINSAGHITGSATTSHGFSHAFAYFGGTMTDLGSITGANGTSAGYAINSAGIIAGSSSYMGTGANTTSTMAAIYANNRWTPVGNATVLPIRSGASAFILRALNSTAYGINDSNVATGTMDYVEGYTTTNGVKSWVTEVLAAMFSGGKGVSLGNGTISTNNGLFVESFGINQSGQQVGLGEVETNNGGLLEIQAAIYANGVTTALGALTQTAESVATAINNSGGVVGYSPTSNTSITHAVLFNNGSAATDLGAMSGNNSRAYAINNAGDIVGDLDATGFLYTGGVMTDLNNLSLTGAANYTILTANGINDAGQIVGRARNLGGQAHGYLLTPSDKAMPPALGANLTDAVQLKGDNLLLDPAITGSNPLTIQWYKNKVALAGQTGLTLNLTNLQTTQTGNYSVIATNLVGTVSDNMTLTVDVPMSVTKPPASIGVIAGKPAKFSVTAAGTAPVSYLWQVSTDGGENWTNVTNGNGTTGATLATLTIAKANQGQDTQQFRCVISNPASNVTTDPVTLAVGTPPKITVPPVNLNKVLGQDATFSATATGTPTPTYQWYKGKTLLEGETNSTLTLANVQSTAADTYSVIATNLLGSATAKATLKLVLPAVITKQPVNASVVSGKPAKFTLTATGTTKLTYQWQTSVDGNDPWTNVPKATTNTLTIAKATPDLDTHQYRCVVDNPATMPATSNAVTLAVGIAPKISPALANQTATTGADVSFTVAATGTETLTYQWFKGKTLLEGQTTATLMLSNVQKADATTYSVTVTNAFGTVTGKATLKVTP